MKQIKQLTIQQQMEAEALYLHLLNHNEVQPICKICNKSAHEILMSMSFMKQMSELIDKTEESPYNTVQRMALLVLNRNKQIKDKDNKLMLIKSDLDRAIINKNWFDVKLARGRF